MPKNDEPRPPKGLTKAQKNNRVKFLKVAEEKFTQYGFKKTTIEDICQSAGLSKPTFYSLFKNKVDLLSQTFVHVSDSLILEWHSKLSENATAREKLQSLLEYYEQVIVRREIFTIILEDPETMQTIPNFFHDMEQHPIFGCFRDIIAQGIKNGEFNVKEPDAAIWMIYSILDGIYLLYPMMTGNKGALENKKFAQEARDFIFKGLGVQNDG